MICTYVPCWLYDLQMQKCLLYLMDWITSTKSLIKLKASPIFNLEGKKDKVIFKRINLFLMYHQSTVKEIINYQWIAGFSRDNIKTDMERLHRSICVLCIQYFTYYAQFCTILTKLVKTLIICRKNMTFNALM